MDKSEGHRKRVKHYDVSGHGHELTFSCYQRRPLLDDPFKVLLSRAIDSAVRGKAFRLVGFVYMPEHVHLIVFPRLADCSVSSLLYAIKRPHSYRVREAMKKCSDRRLPELMIRERPGRRVFRFWQEGGGYDRNLKAEKAVGEALEYLHGNPVRRRLCTVPGQWKWSSWHYYWGNGNPDPALPHVHGLP